MNTTIGTHEHYRTTGGAVVYLPCTDVPVIDRLVSEHEPREAALRAQIADMAKELDEAYDAQAQAEEDAEALRERLADIRELLTEDGAA